MSRQTTPKKIEANRRNASLSTGPKSPAGKERVRRNAMKHGLLAQEAVISAGDGKESSAQFDALLRSLAAEFRPEGALEEMLVERIAVCYWRLRRALRCEVGEIRAALDTHLLDGAIEDIKNVEQILQGPCLNVNGHERQLLLSTAGVRRLMQYVQDLIREVQENGEFEEDKRKRILKTFGYEDGCLGLELICLNRLMSADAQEELSEETGDEEPLPDAEACRATVLELLQDKLRSYENAIGVMQEREELKTQSRQGTLSLPAGNASERILRYETTIERQMYRAMHELQRLQAGRAGAHVLPPVVVEVNGDALEKQG